MDFSKVRKNSRLSK